MSDLIFVGIVVVFFVVSALYVRFCEKLEETPMETIIVGIIAFLLFIYLFVAMIWPEKF